MAETTSVSAQGMPAAGDWITVAEGRLATMRLQFDSIKASSASRWTGDVASAFQGALVQWNRNYNEIIVALNGLRRDMGGGSDADDPDAE